LAIHVSIDVIRGVFVDGVGSLISRRGFVDGVAIEISKVIRRRLVILRWSAAAVSAGLRRA
jgi:hypothetical protein